MVEHMFDHGGVSTTVTDLRELLARTQREGARLPAVTTASATPVTAAVLPVLEPLRPLLPGGGLRRGSTVEVGARVVAEGESDLPAGGCALVLSLLAGASKSGSWCVLVGAPGLGLVAAAEAGIDLARFALVPAPGKSWARAVGALVDGFDLVAVRPPSDLAASEARALSARARHHGSVLVSLGTWPGAELRLAPVRSDWVGLGAGHGRLSSRRVLVQATGRGAAGGRPRSVELWLPAADGVPAAAAAMPAPVAAPVEAAG